MSTNKRKGIPAGAFMASLSSGGRNSICVACLVEAAPHHSLYCSEACKREFLDFSKPAKHTVVDRWDGQKQKWIEVRLEWDGTAYKEIQ